MLLISDVVDQLYLAFLFESTWLVGQPVGKCSILVGKLHIWHSEAFIVGNKCETLILSNKCGWIVLWIFSLLFQVTRGFVSQPPICVPHLGSTSVILGSDFHLRWCISILFHMMNSTEERSRDNAPKILIFFDWNILKPLLIQGGVLQAFHCFEPIIMIIVSRCLARAICLIWCQ